MKTSIRRVALFFALVIASNGEVSKGDFQVSCNGVIHGSPSLGRTMWTGKMSVNHSLFMLEVDGQTSLFSGPSLRHKHSGSAGLRVKDLTLDREWISLVALGDIKITIINLGKNRPPISARQFVYIPGKDQILIDGKPWGSESRTAGELPSPNEKEAHR